MINQFRKFASDMEGCVNRSNSEWQISFYRVSHIEMTKITDPRKHAKAEIILFSFKRYDFLKSKLVSINKIRKI